MNINFRQLQYLAWGLALLVSVLAVAVWLQELNGGITTISSYRLFPLFGLLAFGLMWGHYVMSAVRQLQNIDRSYLSTYFRITGWLVLLLILLHPGLLMWQLWHDGFGLPPGSVMDSYVGRSMRGAVAVGTVSLLAFLAFEFYRFFSERSWWRWVQYASDIAMIGILYHAWQLGGLVRSGWYSWVWLAYAVTFFGALFYTYYLKFQSSLTDSNKEV